jgi:hypothetical protein
MNEVRQSLPSLFEDKERTRIEPKAPGEDDYSFYDSSARPPYDVYRALLNGWMKQMPEAGQKELLPRFRRNESLEYQAALAELVTHASLKNEGYEVEIHPQGGMTDRKPDFLARDADGAPVAYVEVTTFCPSRDFVGKQKHAADIYNGVDKAKLPAGCRLGLDIRKRGSNTPSLKKLRSMIEKWARGIGEVNPDDPPLKVFEIDDWKIEIILFGDFRADVDSKHAIATAMGDARIVSAETEIREALSTKGKRYGDLDAPYLIVIADCKDELQGGSRNDEALIDAVFGKVVTQTTVLENGETEIKDVRLDDGYWGHPKTSRHKNVSGVLLLPKPHLWDLREERWQPLLLRNPWAEHPFPADFLPLPDYAVDEEGNLSKTDGRSFADILKLPKDWPPADSGNEAEPATSPSTPSTYSSTKASVE